jgi:K+-sensing histidine kinase KdpD
MPAASAFSAILGTPRVGYHGHKADQRLPGKRMGLLRRAAPVAVVLAIVSAVTMVLWLVKTSAVGPQHLVFFYLLPIALVATLYGSLLAMMYGIAATLCAAFFLYDPLYSFYVTSPLDVGELICFVGLALIGAKCAADLLQPQLSLPQQKPAAEE